MARGRSRLGNPLSGRSIPDDAAGYTAARFWIELLRVDPTSRVFGGRVNVLTSAVVLAAAVIVFVALRRSDGRIPA